MPWFADNRADINLGQDIFGSKIIRFIAQQAYIERLSNFSIFHFVDGKLHEPGEREIDRQSIKAKSPGAIWVSVPRHSLELITDLGDPDEGIGQSATGIDFAIPGGRNQIKTGIEKGVIQQDFIIGGVPEKKNKSGAFKIKWT